MTTAEFVTIFTGCYLVFEIFMGGLFLVVTGANAEFDTIEFVMFNPIQLYKKTKLNRVGAWMVGLFMSVIFPVWSIPYWIYKAFTVGR